MTGQEGLRRALGGSWSQLGQQLPDAAVDLVADAADDLDGLAVQKYRSILPLPHRFHSSVSQKRVP